MTFANVVRGSLVLAMFLFLAAPSDAQQAAGNKAKGKQAKEKQAKDKAPQIAINYKIPGADKKGKVFVQHIGGRGVIGVEGPQRSKWNPIDNGGSLLLKDLGSGKYQVTRYRQLDVCQAGSGRMHIGVFIDRHQFQLQVGETKQIDFVRSEGQRLKGRVLGLEKAKLDRAAIFVCSTNLEKHSERSSLDVTVYDARLCNDKGEFETEQLPFGDYVLLVEAYVPPTKKQLFRTGRRGPGLVGLRKFTISPQGKVEPIEIALEDVTSK